MEELGWMEEAIGMDGVKERLGLIRLIGKWFTYAFNTLT